MLARIAMTGLAMIVAGGALAAAPGSGEDPPKAPAPVEPQAQPSQPAPAPKYREHHDVNAVVTPATPPATPLQKPRQPATRMEILANAAKDLAGRLGVDAGAIEVLAAETVTWDDSSLGCPQPEQSYTPAQIPGLKLLFSHAQKMYQYHAADDGRFIYCANPEQLAAPYATK